MQLYTQSTEVGTAVEDLRAEVEGDSIAIGFNHNYIYDGLTVLTGDTVSLEIQAPGKPGIFKSEEERYLYLVMPVRLLF